MYPKNAIVKASACQCNCQQNCRPIQPPTNVPAGQYNRRPMCLQANTTADQCTCRPIQLPTNVPIGQYKIPISPSAPIFPGGHPFRIFEDFHKVAWIGQAAFPGDGVKRQIRKAKLLFGVGYAFCGQIIADGTSGEFFELAG